MSKFPPVTDSRTTFGRKTRAAPVGVLTPPVKSLVLLTAGDITVKTLTGPNLAFVGLPAGYIIPFIVSEVVALANGATAATIED